MVRPHNLMNLWGLWELLNLELSEGAGGLRKFWGVGVCSRDSMVGTPGLSRGVPTACLVGMHTFLEVLTRLSEWRRHRGSL